MLTAAGSPLVVGASPGSAMDKTTKVRVLRPFLMRGVRKETNAELEMPTALAVELAGMNKVALLPAVAVPKEAPKEAPKPAKKEG